MATQEALSGISSDKFWTSIDGLIATSEVVIDRPKGSRHPKVDEAIYPTDYGYLKGTIAADGDGIDIWMGSMRPPVVTGVVCTVDRRKRDAEIKVLLGCTRDEEVAILTFLNKGNMSAVLLWRPDAAAQLGREDAGHSASHDPQVTAAPLIVDGAGSAEREVLKPIHPAAGVEVDE
jgi:inorganic pyrophosphatase